MVLKMSDEDRRMDMKWKLLTHSTRLHLVLVGLILTEFWSRRSLGTRQEDGRMDNISY